MNPKKPRKRKRDGVLTDDIKHPDLYRQILAWRGKKAAEMGYQPANVMQQRAMINLTNYMPGDMASLVAVPFIGKQSAKRYGSELLAIIHNYATKRHEK